MSSIMKTPGNAKAASTLSIPLHHLSKYVNLKADPDRTSLEEVVKNSNMFPVRPPVSSILCDTLLKSDKGITNIQLEDYINSAYPLVHEEALFLYVNFLEHKKKFGTNVEKDLYANMDLTDFVDRLLQKRAVAFFDKGDRYLLMNLQEGDGGWESIGKNNEKSPLVLADYISYDEVKLSAFLSVASKSVFINDGNRNNMGIPSDDDSSFQKNGIIVGLIGARLEKPDVMDWEELIISADQNTNANGYGARKGEDGIHQWRRLWANLYKFPSLPAYDEVRQSGRFVKLDELLYFDNDMFKKRVALSVETLLLEAEHRAATCNTNAYVNVIGIGLGVWSISPHQDELFLESFIDCLKRLSPVLKHVSDIHFLWFKTDHCIGMPKGEKKEIKRDDGSSILIHFSRGAPHARLENEDADKLLVVSYAWDGNAQPGNEFWMGALDSSGDPAAACSTQVAELHNPHVNPKRVSGSNLHVASRKWGVLHISEYAQKKLENIKTPLESNETTLVRTTESEQVSENSLSCCDCDCSCSETE